MYSPPCAKFTMRVTPKISDSPAATRNSVDALASPLRTWIASEDMLLGGTELLHLGVEWQEVGPVRIFPGGHHALAVLHSGAPDVGAHRRLVVQRPVYNGAEGSVHAQPLHGLHQLLAVRAPGPPDRSDGGHHGGVADHRA